MKKTSKEIRTQFLDYFRAQGHTVVPSSAVIPFEDPTLLFTNAGMNQFKDLFLGKAFRDYKRATTSQKCIRAGGKHNDLENVGHTSRHLTFFEMLGNFSFGDYFKKEAIRCAWEVSTKIFGFEPDRIWPTVFLDDHEAFELWQQYVPASRITRMGEKDNFWSMGDVGPCGPCSELYYDRGDKLSQAQNPAEDPNGERFLEFWNLVFMQFNKNLDGSLTPLPKPSIDTGAGLERIMSLIAGEESVFETDILRGLIHKVEELSGIVYDRNDHKKAPAFRVIADHTRTLCFALADGAQPSNVERGYVLRKILRRAVRYGKQLGFDAPFLANLIPTLIALMGDTYPELSIAEARIKEILTREEEQFFKTLKRGGALLAQVLERSVASGVISGDDAFKLKDTYGLPIEEIQLIAIDSDIRVDLDRYNNLEKDAKQRSKASSKESHQIVENSFFEELLSQWGPNSFIRTTKDPYSTVVLGILSKGEFVQEIAEGEEADVFLAETPFYAEMGGQVGDTGFLESINGSFDVHKCFSPYKGFIAHRGILKRGFLKVNSPLMASIDKERRNKIECNHTATHLLHWALHAVLGEHSRQAGSVVDQDRLRFDFSHHKPLTSSEIVEIERLVNEKIRENCPVNMYEIAYEEARNRQDIKQFFGEKYGSIVRVIDAGDSKELCGGTHTSRTGNIGYFRISKESSIAAGTRRIEAVTGVDAENHAYASDQLLASISKQLGCLEPKIQEQLQKLLEEKSFVEQKLKTFESRRLQEISKSLSPQNSSSGISYIQHIAPSGSDIKELSEVLAKSFSQSIILLGVEDGDRAQLLVRVPKDALVDASSLLKNGLPAISGKGGGRKDMAQGSGGKIEGIPFALQSMVEQL